MSKSYEYKCPDCGKFVDYGDKFCKNCSCKLDWRDETNDTFKEEKKKLILVKSLGKEIKL